MKKKGGRPILKQEEKKEHRLYLRFTTNQKNALIQKGVYDSVSLVDIIFAKYTHQIESNKTNKVSLANNLELNKIGTNLNQLVKKANSIDALSDDDIKKIRLILGEISDILSK